MQGLIRTALFAVIVAVSGAAAVAQEQPAAPVVPRFGPPASVAAAPIPKAEDTNAERAKTQPGNNAPFWRGVHDSGNRPGRTTLPGAEQGVLIQPFIDYPGSRLTNAGEAWRQVRNGWIIPYGGALVIIALVALALLYFAKGPFGHAENRGGRIERFTYFERAAHWVNAVAFCVLAVSGLVMAFGKFFLLPLTGHTLFGWITYALKTAHNLVGPLFAVALLIVIVTFIRDNVPRKGDVQWVAKGGGLLQGKELPSHRFNGGEKLIFWVGTLIFGIVSVGSGLVLDKLIPNLDYLRGDMQVAHMIHSVSAVLMVAVMSLHIYLGTVGVRGAYRAMRDGDVDDEWAREHHELWYRDIQQGKIPARRTRERPSARPAPQP
jgi:formate dehydrogenase subunit gamma